jgi:DNA-directed RNA polymerase specialized sigma24 family protein
MNPTPEDFENSICHEFIPFIRVEIRKRLSQFNRTTIDTEQLEIDVLFALICWIRRTRFLEWDEDSRILPSVCTTITKRKIANFFRNQSRSRRIPEAKRTATDLLYSLPDLASGDAAELEVCCDEALSRLKSTLSLRDQNILECLQLAYTREEIAMRLSVSVRTVHRSIAHIRANYLEETRDTRYQTPNTKHQTLRVVFSVNQSLSRVTWRFAGCSEAEVDLAIKPSDGRLFGSAASLRRRSD